MRTTREVADMMNNVQNDYKDHDSSAWRCPVCTTANNGNFCCTCGAPRPDAQMKKICPKCGFQNNADARFCSQCAKKLNSTWLDALKEFLRNNRKLIIACVAIVAIFCAFLLKPHEHDWEAATCTAPMTCKSCGETSGAAAAHQWEAATCTTPRTCKVCGNSSGSAKGHQWKEATCEKPKTCEICNLTSGTATGHKWVEETYETPQTCTVCGAIGRGPKQRPEGYVGDLLGYKEKVTLRDGYSTLNVHALVLFDKVERCKQLTINMSVEMKAGTSCTDWNLWGRSGGKFRKIGSVYLPGGDGDTSQTVYFSDPVSFDAVVVTPTKPGGYSWALGFTVTDVWVKK